MVELLSWTARSFVAVSITLVAVSVLPEFLTLVDTPGKRQAWLYAAAGLGLVSTAVTSWRKEHAGREGN